MSFLQINSTDPSVKRPFRLSDIQDIWNGIKSLFKAIAGEDFRIISGFDLVNGTYSSGTVWYNGELYEYNKDESGITPDTQYVRFYKVPQDTRTFEGGNLLPFSYRYVCTPSTIQGATAMLVSTTFASNVEKYKSFLGAGSVTTDKLADEAVTVDKLSLAQAILPVGYTESVWLNPEIENSLANTIFDSENRLWKRCILDNKLPSAVTIDCTGTAALPNIAFVLCYNRDPDTPATVNFKIHDNITLAYQVPGAAIKGFVLIKVGANSHVPL